LQLLLNHIRGPSSFEDLKKVQGIVASTFREVASLHGLLETDNSLGKCLEEASSYQMPYSLRRLFATILVYCNPTNPRVLWEKFEENMSEDFKKSKGLITTLRTRVLQSIASTLESMGKDINTYHLVDYKIIFDETETGSREISDELHILVSPEDLLAVKLLNAQQKYSYELILDKVFSNTSASFFVDGPSGTGKTFLYRVILATVRSKHIIALATASSGVAASILLGGRMAHSRFKIPLDVEKNMTCRISKQSGLAKLLRVAKLIIWDEAPMAKKKQTIEALDQILQDVNESNLPFGGKVVVFGGDFRQVLPVVPKATRHEQIDASLVTSYLWPLLQKIRLTENMRAKLDPMFSEYVLQVGNGTKPITIDNKIELPTTMIIPYIDDMTSLNALIDVVFLNINEYSNNFGHYDKSSYIDT
jgi:hypothetical protein